MRKIAREIANEVWRLFLVHFGKKRFDYLYATKTLGFRERRKKEKRTIAYRSGKTKRAFLNSTIKNGRLISDLPNYTRYKRFKLQQKTSDKIMKALFGVTNYGDIIRVLSKLLPGIPRKILIRTAGYYFKNATQQNAVKYLVVDKSVADELKIVKNSEIQECARKIKKLPI